MADQARQPLFRLRGDGIDAFIAHPPNQRVNKRPERLDQIVGQREAVQAVMVVQPDCRSEEHTSELQSLMRISYAVFCLKKKKTNHIKRTTTKQTQEYTTQTH